MIRLLEDLGWLLLTLAVVGVIWAAAMDLYYDGGPLLSMGVDKFTATLVYLIALVFLYAVVSIGNS